MSGLFRTNFSFEANASSLVSAVDASFANCSANPRGDGSDWLSECNLRLLERLFAINTDRVENLNLILTKSLAFQASCITEECRSIIRFVIDAYTPVAVAAATSCSSPTCIAVASGVSATIIRDILTGGADGLIREKIRFQTSVQSELLQRLEIDTMDFINCRQDHGCKAAAVGRTNTSFAIHGYINQAISYGMVLSDTTARNRLIASLNANFTRCVMTAGACTIQEVNSVYRQKRAVLRYLTVWSDRLNQISTMSLPSRRRRNCIPPQCDISSGKKIEKKKKKKKLWFHNSAFERAFSDN